MAADRIYTITIFRVDGNHMNIFESEDFKTVEAMYLGLSKEWVDSTAEKRPFKLPSPTLHSLLPALISEIKVESMSREEYHRQENPYYKQMQRDGFSGTINRNFNTGGY